MNEWIDVLIHFHGFSSTALLFTHQEGTGQSLPRVSQGPGCLQCQFCSCVVSFGHIDGLPWGCQLWGEVGRLEGGVEP